MCYFGVGGSAEKVFPIVLVEANGDIFWCLINTDGQSAPQGC